MAKQDENYMRMALDFAKRGAGFVSPNPLVGALVVKNGEILAKGFHAKCGAAHAELNALKKLKFQAKGATLYVNLEPCAHHGKTPPCTDAILKSGIKRVVLAIRDPNPLVNGKGINVLRDAGIKVEIGVLADEARLLNEKYCKWIKLRLPFVYLKSAVTIDGALAFKKAVETPLGSKESMARVHEIRHEYDAIAVGINTVLIDDPRLTSRGLKKAINPLRVVFDTRFRIPKDALLFKQEGEVIVFVAEDFLSQDKVNEISGLYPNVKIVPRALKNAHVDLTEALTYLGKEQVSSLLLEGGAGLANAFLAEGLVDKMTVCYTPNVAMKDAPKLFNAGTDMLSLKNPQWELFGDDAWLTFYLEKH